METITTGQNTESNWAPAPRDASAAQLLREHGGARGRDCKHRRQESAGRPCPRSDEEAAATVPISTRAASARTTSTNMLMEEREISQAPALRQSRQQLTTAEQGIVSLPQSRVPWNHVHRSNTKQHQQVVCMCVCVYTLPQTHIKGFWFLSKQQLNLAISCTPITLRIQGGYRILS